MVPTSTQKEASLATVVSSPGLIDHSYIGADSLQPRGVLARARASFVCGVRKGRVPISPSPSGSGPAAEWTLVTSSASSRVSAGKMPGTRRASMLDPIEYPTVRALAAAGAVAGDEEIFDVGLLTLLDGIEARYL